MKMIIAIIHDQDNEAVSLALIQADFRVTRVSSTGGFFRKGSTTLLIGVEDGKVEKAIEIIQSKCSSPEVDKAKKATIFVLNVNQYTQV